MAAGNIREQWLRVAAISRCEDESLWYGGEQEGKWGVIASSHGWKLFGGSGWRWMDCSREMGWLLEVAEMAELPGGGEHGGLVQPGSDQMRPLSCGNQRPGRMERWCL